MITIVVAVATPGVAHSQPATNRISHRDAVATALQRNLHLRAAALDVAIAEAQLAQARGARMPHLALTGAYTRAQESSGQVLSFPNPFGPPPTTITMVMPPPDPNQFLARLTFQVPLYTGGRLESQVALAEANLRGARATLERTRQQVLFATTQHYLQVLLAQEVVVAARRAWNAAEENLRVARARVVAGAAPRFDELQAEVVVATADRAMVGSLAGLAIAQASLNATLQLPLDARLELLDSLDTLTPRPVIGSLPDAIALALRRRPELAEIQSRMLVAQAAIDLAASGGRANLILEAGYSISNAGGTLSGATGSWSVTLAVTLALFDGGITPERTREAQVRLHQLRISEAQVRQEIELDVRQTWVAVEQGMGELRAATKATEHAREAARLAVVRYEAGVGISLEVVAAQSAFAQAEAGLASARFANSLAHLRLLLATGSM